MAKRVPDDRGRRGCFGRRVVRAHLRAVLLAVAACMPRVQAWGDAPEAAGMPAPIAFSDNDRILVLAPHPDDEVIACGGVIQQALAQHLPVRVTFLTYGDNNEWSFLFYRKHAVFLPSGVKQMGLLRHDEAMDADQRLGLDSGRLSFLGYPDFGTLRLWTSHWGGDVPGEGLLTRATRVPYSNALRPGAAYRGDEVIKDLTTVLMEFKPTKVFVSHPADFNVDHRALYCFTCVALWALEDSLRPEVFPYLVHFPHWPQPRGKHTDIRLAPPEYLKEQMTWRRFVLTPAQLSAKETALHSHRTQYEYAATYLESFLRVNELFGDYPVLRLPAANGAPVKVDGKLSGGRYDGKEASQLTETERALFTGVECRTIERDGDGLRVSIALSRPLAEAVETSVHAFGYRADTSFAVMPKINVHIGAIGHSIRDRDHLLPLDAADIRCTSQEIVIRIPLTLLRRPERVFISARTYLGEIPLDWASWRIVDLRPGGP